MKLIVGLGNPGRKFAKTRHNTGHQFILKFKVQISKLKIKNQVKLYKTSVFMNDSGKEIKQLAISYQLSAINDLLIVHDDMDLPLGEFKLQFGRSAAGHKGVQSVIDELGTKNFWRLRIGIGKPPEGVEGEKYVLQPFPKKEWEKIEKKLPELAGEVMDWIRGHTGSGQS